jgi:hypothetical protein
MSNRKVAPTPALAMPAAGGELPLQHGRRLSLVASGGDDLVEVRGAGGALELRIRLTAEGPVLQMESLKLSLKAAQDVEVSCASFSVHAREGLALRADGDVRVNGRMIHLN